MSQINFGDFEPATKSMGPGLNACLWVKGCSIQCKGCITQEFIDAERTNFVFVDEINKRIDRAIEEFGINGLSISGGEPFLQARSLVEIAKFARTQGLRILIWTGFTKEFLESDKAPDGSGELLELADAIIDGPFMMSKTKNALPYRGSTNQRIHLLSDKYKMNEFEQRVMSAKIVHERGQIVATGVHSFRATEAILKILGIT